MSLTSASPLARKLQDSRLGALLPILQKLGVECGEDLQYLEDDDIAKIPELTIIQKRRFLDWMQEWRAKVLEEGSACSSQSGDARAVEAELAQGIHVAASSSTAPVPKVARSSSASSGTTVPQLVGVPQRPQTPQTSLPLQTPRTQTARKSFADTPIEVLKELERLDMSLQEELEHSAELEAELQEERERFARIAEEKQVNEENHARDIAELERLIQHVLSENELLKSTVAAWETTRKDVDEVSDVKSCVTDVSAIRVPRRPSLGQRLSSLGSGARDSAATARDSLEPDMEPEMEPRRTMQPASPDVPVIRMSYRSMPPTSPVASIGPSIGASMARSPAASIGPSIGASISPSMGVRPTCSTSASADVTDRYLVNSQLCWPECHSGGTPR